FFNTNEAIVQSKWTEDEWNAYYEAEIEPVAIQLGQAYSVRLFTRRERSCGNQVVFEASNLQCASLSSKLALLAMVDRGAMTPNEWRATLNMAPIPGGDKPIRRLDTEVVGLIENILGKMNSENCDIMAKMIMQLINAVERRADETQNQYPGRADSEQLQVVL
ncbi:MAG: phage portal protein, partial [Butyrivibrio sp.]|nr:phage portal protein [Butyrivibrio sp.]